jgi:type II secretory pathway component GspD/PulD (secretin)
MNIKSVLASAFSVALAAAFVASTALAASPARPLYSVHLVEVKVQQLAEEVTRATGKTMIIAPTVNDVVTLDTKAPVSADVLFETFIRVLNEKGLRVTQDSNGIIRVTTAYESLGLTWT